MKKFITRISAALAALSLICLSNFGGLFNTSAKAEDAGLTAALYAMTGTLYYYNTPDGKIVINDVKPIVSSSADSDNGTASKALEIADAISYSELPTAEGGRFFQDGSYAAPEWINNYVDRQIWFIAAVAADGTVTIPYFKILV